MTERMIIFANGDLPNVEKARALLEADDFIIAADGGARHAYALGTIPNIIIGDLDSLPVNFDFPQRALRQSEIIRYPRDKNETDLELAIQHALTLKPAQIVVVAALGGRLDQTLGNLFLLSDPKLSTFNIRLDDGVEEAFFCRDHSQIKGRSGDGVSLMPWQGAVFGITARGLKWRLNDETLYPHKTRGVSNEMIDATATVQVKSGSLLVVHRREA